MNPELDKKLCQDFPLLYRDRYGNMRNTCMCWGFPGDGWYDIIRELSQKLEDCIRKDLNKNNTCFCGHSRYEHTATSDNCCHVSYFPYFIRNNYLLEYKNNKIKKNWAFYKFHFIKLTNKVFNLLEDIGIRNKIGCDCKKFQSAHPVAVQVKEKYGTLRFYMSSESEEMSKYIREAEDKSSVTCEECGKPGTTRNDLSWILTLCDEHYNERKMNRQKLVSNSEDTVAYTSEDKKKLEKENYNHMDTTNW